MMKFIEGSRGHCLTEVLEARVVQFAWFCRSFFYKTFTRLTRLLPFSGAGPTACGWWPLRRVAHRTAQPSCCSRPVLRGLIQWLSISTPTLPPQKHMHTAVGCGAAAVCVVGSTHQGFTCETTPDLLSNMAQYCAARCICLSELNAMVTSA